MVTGWIVSITLFAVCGLVALAIVKIIDDLDRTTSIGEDVEAEVRSPYDTDGQGSRLSSATKRRRSLSPSQARSRTTSLTRYRAASNERIRNNKSRADSIPVRPR
jgi:hypothetical protein